MAKSEEVEAFGWAARDPSGVLSPFKFSRRATGNQDVRLKVLYCGICHFDLEMNKNEWSVTVYPNVPGHEIVGIVTEVGAKVQKFKVGDKVGVGALIGSCRKCENCINNLENYCSAHQLTDSPPPPYKDGITNYGGYSDHMVVDEHFVLRWPENLPLDSGAPLLGAGIITYSPLRYFKLDKPGLGGIGHLAVKIAKAFGVKVTVISTSPKKKDGAIKYLGADSFLVSNDSDQMQDLCFCYASRAWACLLDDCCSCVVLGTVYFMSFAVGFCLLDELGLLGPVWAAGFVCKWHSLC
ncbi:unnamed protein product [Ilex paraguariensis]|uniref:Alcohol dehydrogenase N-terminal domain-containing protein n=1 Tax=Ilex paraguariensis TaxID=185542 RepID=A0ABC8SRT0_9AQUA